MPDRPTIITLSSIPPRLPHIGLVLQSLLNQDVPAHAVHLYIPHRYRRFPDWDGRLPDLPAGVTILRVEEDDGPATKLLPALKAFAGQVDILYCDDDCMFAPSWHRAFKAASHQRPGMCITAMGYDLTSMAAATRRPDRLPRATRWKKEDVGAWLATLQAPLPDDVPFIRESGFCDIAMGHGGVLVRPEWFSNRVWQVPDESFAVDDIWLSGNLESHGIPIWAAHHIPLPRTIRPIHLIRPLLTEQIDGIGRDAANARSIRQLRQTTGIWQHPPGVAHPSIEISATPRLRRSPAKKAAKPMVRLSIMRRVRRFVRRLLARG